MTTMVQFHTMLEKRVEIEVATHETEVTGKYPVVMINHFVWFPSMEQLKELHTKLGKYLAENIKELG